MNTVMLILNYLPQLIQIVKKIKLMADDGLSEKEIKDALDKIELAFNNVSDSDVASNLNEQWVSGVQEKDVPPPLPVSKSPGSES